jgi:short-subunit dehydrogenase
VFLGNADPLLRFEGEAEMRALAGVQIVPLDVTDTTSVSELAAQIGGQVEIVVNTSSFVRTGGVAFGGNLRDQKKALEINVLGFSRLAQAFGPALVARAADGANPAVAFVEILPIEALTGSAQFAGLAASAAARLSLQLSLRAEMQAHGIRVMTVFTGPVDDAWHQDVPPPKVLPAQIAKAVVDALAHGREETCVGDVATDLMRKWRQDPKLTIREINA